jgi:hypothetical protein
MRPSECDRFPDLLVIGQEAWDDIERRNQLLTRALARRNPRARFLFVERARRPRELRSWRWPRPRRVAANIWAGQAIRPIPDSVSPTFSDRIECAQIRHLARLVGLDRPLLWTQDPHAARLIEGLSGRGLVYDLTDDWEAFEREPGRRVAVRGQIVSLGRRADLVLACSRSLAQDARSWGAVPVYLPNAVDAAVRELAVPDAVAHLPRPILGYAGTLHSSRLDVDLMSSAALLRPQWSFVLLGPDLLEPADRRRLYTPGNTHYLGACRHADVADYLAGLDVGLLPNLVTEFTRSLDPLKTYEYLAAGLPVVATPAGIPDELAEHVEIAKTPDEFVAKAQKAIDGNSLERMRVRRDAVAGQTWDARAATVERALVSPPAARTSEVSVVIVSFNTRELLERCLVAVREQVGVELQVIVVDNASSDGSSELIAERFPEVELVELPNNVGFARANNLAFGLCRGAYVLLVNSDAFMHRGALAELLAAARRHPHAGAIGPRLLNPDGSLQRSAWPFPDPARLFIEAFGLHRILRRTRFYEDLGTWAHDEERAVDFVIGACLLLRAEALGEAGGFDETFWLYGEETDLQRRMYDRGWSVVFADQAEVTHVGGASPMDSSIRLRHFHAAQMNFLFRHRGLGAVIAARAALAAGSVLRGRWKAARIAVTRDRN